MTYSSFLTVDYVVFTYILTCLCNVLRILKMCTCYFCKIKVVVFPGPRPSAPYVDPRPPPPRRPHKIFKCCFWLFICLCYKVLLCSSSYTHLPVLYLQILQSAIKRPTDSNASTTSGQTCIWVDKQVLRVIRVAKGVLLVARRVLR